MAIVTTYMGLSVWDQETDVYGHDDLAGNWEKVDAHDHSSNGGAPLPADAIPVITSDGIGNGAVGTNQLANHSVTQIKLAIPAVGTSELYNDSVTNAKIANSAVDTAQLQNDAVTGPKIADASSDTGAAILGAHINDGAIANRHLADSSVNSVKLTSGSVHTGNLQDDAVTAAKLAAGAVTAQAVAANAVTNTKLAAGSVSDDKFDYLPAVYVKTNQAKDAPTGQTHILWDVEVYDTDGMFHSEAPGWITIQTAGVYIVTAGVYWQDHTNASSDSGSRRMTIRVNRANQAGSGPAPLHSDWRTFDDNTGFPVGSSVQALQQNASVTLVLNGGDSVDVAVFSDYEGGSQYLPNDSSTHLSATWLAPAP